jgi:very-short-patch-repair endonuclease
LHALDLGPDGRITLQYALLRAIAELWQAEESEIGAVLVGDPESPNILIYENAEGSLGILSDLVCDPEAMSRIAAKAWEICGFENESNKLKASYDDLLTYYNQREHARIDRFTIRNALGLLSGLKGEVRRSGTGTGTGPLAGGDYETLWRELRDRVDPAASTEVRFLDALRERGLRLPDGAQKQIEGLYVRPDFYYEPKVLVFCDGSPHDRQDLREDDDRKRDALRERGWQVLAWRYDQDLDAFFGARPDVFRKVKS